jgi:ComF family protein
MSLRDELTRWLRQLAGECCLRCGAADTAGFCNDCRGDFGLVPLPCPHCGLPRPAHRCPARAPDWRLDAVRAPFRYAEPLATCLQALKYAKRRRLGAALGDLLAERIGCAGAECDRLVPVPLHSRRLRERGFNQADEIARQLARRIERPLVTAGILRRRDTRPQTGQGGSDRRHGLVGAFAATGELAGAKLAIVDDVITTGATVNALATALKAAGAVRVEAWALARTIAPGADQGTRNR